MRLSKYKTEKTTTITFKENELDQLHLLLDNGFGDGDWEETYCIEKRNRQALHRGWGKIQRARQRLLNKSNKI
tara:strand:- start:133 stop:351 length:219 start_codon:yes stop_codon:yes gene_type:complete